LSLENQPIIVEVREFQGRIQDLNSRLKSVDSLLSELNTKLILQDMDNATILINKKANKLRERLNHARAALMKIQNCGEEMDGNTTASEEDEFIDTLKGEMPEVFKNIGINFEQIDGIDELIKQVTETKDINKMKHMKAEVDDATNKVVESEGLVVKLEQEIIEWNALKKLIKRDTELEDVEIALRELKNVLRVDGGKMEEEKEKIQKKMEKEGEPKDGLQVMMGGIGEYLAEVEQMQQELAGVKDERQDCFEAFNDEIPQEVRAERAIRKKNAPEPAKSKGKRASPDKPTLLRQAQEPESDKPNDIYYMLSVNCKFKKLIQVVMKKIERAKRTKAALEERHGPLKENLSKLKSAPVYKPIKGDDVDELLGKHLNACNLAVPVKRLAAGKYLFGSKQILAKIINGKLVIRVGGGYMSAEEFIETYGRMEMLKLAKQEQLNQSCSQDSARSLAHSRSGQSLKSTGGHGAGTR